MKKMRAIIQHAFFLNSQSLVLQSLTMMSSSTPAYFAPNIRFSTAPRRFSSSFSRSLHSP